MKLMEMLPEAVYHDEPHVVVFQEAIGEQVAAAQRARDDLKQQARPGTATAWGLARYERAWGLPVDDSKPPAQRLAALRGKRRGVGTTTVEAIRRIAESFYSGEVVVTEYQREFWVEVSLASPTEREPNLTDAKLAIAEVIPAHMEVVYAITWKAHAELYIRSCAEMSLVVDIWPRPNELASAGSAQVAGYTEYVAVIDTYPTI